LTAARQAPVSDYFRVYDWFSPGLGGGRRVFAYWLANTDCTGLAVATFRWSRLLKNPLAAQSRVKFGSKCTCAGLYAALSRRFCFAL
jgi:hypothetical protein